MHVFLGFTDSNLTLGTILVADKSRPALNCDTKCFAIILFCGTFLFYTMIFCIIYKVHLNYTFFVYLVKHYTSSIVIEPLSSTVFLPEPQSDTQVYIILTPI